MNIIWVTSIDKSRGAIDRWVRTSPNSSATLRRSLSSSDSSLRSSSVSVSSSLSLTSENFFTRRLLPGKYPKPPVSSCSFFASVRRVAFRALVRPISSRCSSSHALAWSCCSWVNTMFMGAASVGWDGPPGVTRAAGRKCPRRLIVLPIETHRQKRLRLRRAYPTPVKPNPQVGTTRPRTRRERTSSVWR